MVNAVRKYKKIILFTILIILSFNLVSAITDAEFARALKKSLLEYFTGAGPKTLILSEIQDMLEFYLITPDVYTVTLSAVIGSRSGETMEYIYNRAAGINIALPTCTDITEYGECSSNKPKYCFNGNLEDRCSLCGCDPPDNCKTDESCGCTPQAEICTDGIDNDCDSFIDGNQGANSDPDCCAYTETEICNNADDNCNGQRDEGLSNCRCTTNAPIAEECNGIDDNCDELIDNGIGCNCFNGQTRACTGFCAMGTETCINGIWDSSACTMPADDANCGTIACSGWYVQTGIESATATEYCYNKVDIATNRCEGINDCKDTNTADCDAQPNNVLQYSCGTCCYISASSCTGTTLGSCTNYPSSQQGPTADYYYASGKTCYFRDYHCTGNSCAETYTDSVQISCGTCQQLTAGTCTGSMPGSCSNIADGTDPYNDCAGALCQSAGYYFGWVDNTCYYKAGNYGTNCNGAGACRSAAQDCSSQAQGASTGISCSACQTQTGCSGTTLGSCPNSAIGTACTGGNICDGNGNCIPNSGTIRYAKTSTYYNGNLGGFLGGNQKCQQEFGSGWQFEGCNLANFIYPASMSYTYESSCNSGPGAWIGRMHKDDCGSWTSSNGCYEYNCESSADCCLSSTKGTITRWNGNNYCRSSEGEKSCSTARPLLCCKFEGPFLWKTTLQGEAGNYGESCDAWLNRVYTYYYNRIPPEADSEPGKCVYNINNCYSKQSYTYSAGNARPIGWAGCSGMWCAEHWCGIFGSTSFYEKW